MRMCVVVMVLGANACGGAAQPASRPQQVSSQTGARHETGDVAVIEAGAEPRRVVTFSTALHVPEPFEVTTDFTFTLSVANGGRPASHQNLKPPRIKLLGHSEATQQMPDGGSRVETRFDDFVLLDSVDAGTRANIEKTFQSFKNMTSSVVRSPNGSTSEPLVTGSQAMAAIFASGNTNGVVKVVFPSVAVGGGASWRSTSTNKMMGASWELDTTYRLRELTDTHAVIDFDAVTTAKRQTLSLEPNASTTLTSGKGTMHGSVDVPLGGLVAPGEAHGTLEANLETAGGHTQQVVSMQGEFATTLSKRAP
jgi:hypothetical protein